MAVRYVRSVFSLVRPDPPPLFFIFKRGEVLCILASIYIEKKLSRKKECMHSSLED